MKTEYSVNSCYPTREVFLEFCTEKQKTICNMFFDLWMSAHDKSIEQRLFIGLSTPLNNGKKYNLHFTVMNIYAPNDKGEILYIEDLLELDGYRSNLITYYRTMKNGDILHQHNKTVYLNPYGMPSMSVLKKLIGIM